MRARKFQRYESRSDLPKAFVQFKVKLLRSHRESAVAFPNPSAEYLCSMITRRSILELRAETLHAEDPGIRFHRERIMSSTALHAGYRTSDARSSNTSSCDIGR